MSLKDDLRAELDLVETHVSWVFLGPTQVWKVKKPVSLGFLDFRTVEARHAACRAEVELNRRLAPEVYLGVVPITRDRAGRHRIDGEGETADWAVHMRRLPDHERADRRLADGRLSLAQVEHLAERIARFHRDASIDGTRQYGTRDQIGRNVEENFAQTRDSILGYVSPAEAREIERFQHDFLAAHESLFDRRLVEGRIRDGHGDLRMEHVYFGDDDTVRVLDCIEFNERFRIADVAADVAFFSMDLAWHGRVDWSERFLAAYAREANDYGLYPLIDFYSSYRAYVRGKVASLLAADPGADLPVREAAAREARRYYLLALASDRRPAVSPALVAVGGGIASGKSTVATQIGGALSAPIVDTDRTRKFLLGVEPLQPMHEAAWSGAYDPEVTARVYREALERARAVVQSGRPVVVDGSFRSREDRRAAQALARESGVPFFFVECRAPPEVARARLVERARSRSVSDGRIEIFDQFVAGFEPVDELPAEAHIVVDTTRPLEENVRVLRTRLPAWPPGLTA